MPPPEAGIGSDDAMPDSMCTASLASCGVQYVLLTEIGCCVIGCVLIGCCVIGGLFLLFRLWVDCLIGVCGGAIVAVGGATGGVV